MRACTIVGVVGALAALLTVTEPTAQPAELLPARCDRACLASLVERYLDAVVAHDPARLPLSAEVRYTENEQRVPVGDGFWRTATGRGNYAHPFADPDLGQAAWMGTMREGNVLLLIWP